MAAKVFLQSEDAKATEKVKRSAAESLVRRLLAVQISSYIYRRVIARSVKAIASRHYIPAKMPSHKTPGTKAEGPLVEKSRTGIFRIMQANHIAREIRA